MSELRRLFEEDIREKKRIGRGIFSRKSTRRGGFNSPLKTPYYYMSKKEKMALNGKVKVYLEEDVIPYRDFIIKDASTKVRLISLWIKSYRKIDISHAMGISSSTFYRLLGKIERMQGEINQIGGDYVMANKPTEEKLEEFKTSMMSYEEFRQKSNPEKNNIVEEYVQFFGTIAELNRNWESSDLAYLYSVHHRIKKRKEKQAQLEKEQRAKDAKIARDLKQAQKNKDEKYRGLQNVMDSIPDGSLKTAEEPEREEKKAILHNSSLNIATETLSFALNGRHDGESIARLLSLASEVISKSSGKLNIELKITQGEG